ncbi:MAG: flagellar basal body P-ring formation chaperone FlgA, partial [Pseudomonadota bacterium]|nr:flagellar basal body P-ring formation chaperone FlgA [Pseudomonadota bacterium]
PRDQFFAARNLRKGQMLVAADVYTAQYVAIADKTIPMGHPITTDLFRLQKVTSRVPNDAVTDLSGLEHLAANRLIHQKSILRKRDLKKAKLVQRGEQLILSAGSQNYSIETIAVALQDGYFGDQIRLRNLASNQEVRAVVSGINRAKALR